MKKAFDVDKLKKEIETERQNLANLSSNERNYNELCRMLTKLKYHTSKETRQNTINRAIIHNAEIKERHAFLTIS